MKQKYRIFVLGELPVDLRERVAALHAASILKGKSGDVPVHAQAKNCQNAGAIAAVRLFDSIRK